MVDWWTSHYFLHTRREFLAVFRLYSFQWIDLGNRFPVRCLSWTPTFRSSRFPHSEGQPLHTNEVVEVFIVTTSSLFPVDFSLYATVFQLCDRHIQEWQMIVHFAFNCEKRWLLNFAEFHLHTIQVSCSISHKKCHTVKVCLQLYAAPVNGGLRLAKWYAIEMEGQFTTDRKGFVVGLSGPRNSLSGMLTNVVTSTSTIGNSCWVLLDHSIELEGKPHYWNEGNPRVSTCYHFFKASEESPIRAFTFLICSE